MNTDVIGAMFFVGLVWIMWAIAAWTLPYDWEVFDPADGTPIYRLKWRWLAYVAVKVSRNRLDFAKRGEGWIK